MNASIRKPDVYLASKQHYEILDALRGVAALTVVWFHLFETFTYGNHYAQVINHGYLAVDFFFVLSGFVIGYAYDDRWDKMSLGNFFKRRIIRLHPMIIIGSLIGALTFYFQASPVFPNIASTPLWKLGVVFLLGCILLAPVTKNFDIRGWTEMHPLNGPAWTLFFEYIANILYGLFVHKFSNKLLAFVVFIFALITLEYTTYASPDGYIIGGWNAFDPMQLRIGFTRLLYPFFAGLLLSRVAKIQKYDHSFLLCSILILVLLAVPNIGGPEHHWMNGLYESFCIIIMFPFIVYLGACGKVTGKKASKVCKFLGDISFPIYITHYPLIYLFTAWFYNHHMPKPVPGQMPQQDLSLVPEALPWMLLVFFSAVAIAYLSMHYYDVPVRAWLRKKCFKHA